MMSRADLAINGTASCCGLQRPPGYILRGTLASGSQIAGDGLLKGSRCSTPESSWDFNEWTSGLATQLLREHLKSAELRSRSYPGLMPVLHLDHIYYDEALRLEKLTLHRTRKALVASDHLPLSGDFEVAAVEAPASGGHQKEKGSK